MIKDKDKSFAAKLFSEEEMPDVVKGPSHERAFAAQATNLRIWDKTGRLAAGLAWWFGVAEVQPWLGRDFNWAGSNDGVEVWERGVYARRPMESLKK